MNTYHVAHTEFSGIFVFSAVQMCRGYIAANAIISRNSVQLQSGIN